MAAIQADPLSPCAFEADEPPFWFLTRIGIGVGLRTTCPANRALVRHGIKKGT